MENDDIGLSSLATAVLEIGSAYSRRVPPWWDQKVSDQMTWLAFFAEVIQSVAWPFTVLAIFAVLRGPIQNLLPLLVKVKYKELEIDFSRRLEEVASEIPVALPAPDRSAEESLLKVAAVSPRAAILEAWLRVERAALEFAKVRGLGTPKPESRVIAALAQSNTLDSWQITALKELRGLRNSAAHISQFEPSPASAAEYVRLALELEQSLGDFASRA